MKADFTAILLPVADAVQNGKRVKGMQEYREKVDEECLEELQEDLEVVLG